MTQVVEKRWKQAVDSTVNKIACSTAGTRNSQVDHMEKMFQEVLAATKEQFMMSSMAKREREMWKYPTPNGPCTQWGWYFYWGRVNYRVVFYRPPLLQLTLMGCD